jgi:short-subunit dehydrogenase
MKNTKIFLITGASAGLGRAFAEAAVEAGHTVVGTVRREDDRVAFEAMHTRRARAVIIDVTRFDTIAPMIQKVEEEIGSIDVLVNSAGYGHEGTLEESPLTELIRQFEVNVFGAVAMIKAVLPRMRQRRRGHIINVTSMAGHMSMPGIAYYSGSKFALEGISEALARRSIVSASRSPRSRQAHSAPSGRAVRWSDPNVPLRITTPFSSRSASAAGSTAAVKPVIRPRPLRSC